MAVLSTTIGMACQSSPIMPYIYMAQAINIQEEYLGGGVE